MAEAGLLLARNQRQIVGQFLAEAAGRQATELRARASQRIAFAGALTSATADIACQLLTATGTDWPGDLEDLVRTAMGIDHTQ